MCKIIDWAGNIKFEGKTFNCFDEAEEFLFNYLDECYEEWRQEYEIVEIE